MIFLSNRDVMLDRNVRLAAHHAIDKQAIVARLLRGYGVPLSTLQAPQYAAYDAGITVAHDPRAGARPARQERLLQGQSRQYSPSRPPAASKPKDYEMIQAVVGMWRAVGIDATIDVYEIAQHYELRTRHALAPAAFYNWGNAIGDPSTSSGFALYGPLPSLSGWRDRTFSARIDPLWSEPDEQKRLAGYKAVDRIAADEGLVIPLLQYVQPIIHRANVAVTPQVNGMLLPQRMHPA